MERKFHSLAALTEKECPQYGAYGKVTLFPRRGTFTLTQTVRLIGRWGIFQEYLHHES